MKKLFAFLGILSILSGSLAGCGGVPVAEEKPSKEPVKEEQSSLKTGLSVSAHRKAESASAEKEGAAVADILITAVTVDHDGVIESCRIDSIEGKLSFNTVGQVTSGTGEILSKNELGEDYGMKKQSPIGKEWKEQAAAFAQYAEGKTIEELKKGAVDENGMAKDAELSSSATIYLGDFMKEIERAVENAADLGAKRGERLTLTAISRGSGDTSAGETEGSVSVVSDIAAVTMNGDVITSCIIDSVQSKTSFDGTGAVTGEESGEILSKNQLGESYGVKKNSSIGKEWNEQIASFCAYVTGKTEKEVAGIALTESDAPAEADLAATVTVSIRDYIKLIEKAAKSVE